MFNALAWKIRFTVEEAKNAVKRQEGQGLVEYALIIALVSILLVAVLLLMKTQIATTFNYITGTLSNANAGS